MFPFFKKKEKTIPVTDKVFLSDTAKKSLLLQLKDSILIAWFEESFEQMQEWINTNNSSLEVLLAREISLHGVANKRVIFIEHYPLASKENELFEKLQLQEATFYTSLDEPLFTYFGGNRIMELMKKMGAAEHEQIQHPLISTSIRNAQEKIAEKITTELSARSQAGWFSKNLH